MSSNPAMKNSAVTMACNPLSCAKSMRGRRKNVNRRLFTLEALPFSERFVRRGGKHSLGIPSHLVPASNDVGVQIQNAAPFGNTLGFSAPINQAVNASIAHLFTPGSPAAILRRVWPLIVDTVNAVSGRTFAHIFKKRLETVAPAVTDFDSACSVIPVVLASRVFATLDNPTPNVVQRRSGQAMRPRRLPRGGAFLAPASARFSSAFLLHEKRPANLALCTAIAATQKNIGIIMDFPRVAENRPAMELLSGKVSRHLQMVTENKAIGKEEKNNEQ